MNGHSLGPGVIAFLVSVAAGVGLNLISVPTAMLELASDKELRTSPAAWSIMPPCRYSIAPGSTLAGFSFRSIHPPGNVSFSIQGEKKWPVATDDDDDIFPGVNSGALEDNVPGVTTGPVRMQSCSGAADGAVCDDGYFCNGPDHC